LGDGRRLQLIEQRQFEPVGQKALSFKLAEELLHLIAGNHHYHHGLQVALGMRQNTNAPDDLRDRHRRQLLQLQLHHRRRFVEIASRELRHPQEHALGRQPGDVELTLQQRVPILRDEPGRQWLPGKTRQLAVELKTPAPRVELPNLSRLGADLKHVASMDVCRPRLSFRWPGCDLRRGLRFGRFVSLGALRLHHLGNQHHGQT
jgi:hypothetical protein